MSRARTYNNKSAQHFPTLKIDFYFLYTECGGLVCLRARTFNTYTNSKRARTATLTPNLEHEQTDKHKLVTHNLGDIGKVRARAYTNIHIHLHAI